MAGEIKNKQGVKEKNRKGIQRGRNW